MSSLFCTTGIFSKHAVSGRLNLPLRFDSDSNRAVFISFIVFQIIKKCFEDIFVGRADLEFQLGSKSNFFSCKRPFSRQQNEKFVDSRGQESNKKIHTNVSYSVLVNKNWSIYSFSSHLCDIKTFETRIIHNRLPNKNVLLV